MTGKILLIEDERRLRLNLQLLLKSEGHTVVAAADGREGLQCLQQETFDLVITDVMMGDVNGFQVMEYIAAQAPDTLVIVITGYASTESAVEALRQGAYDYITKPFEIEIVQISVQRALEKVRLQQALKRHMEELEQRVAERTRELEVTNRALQQSLGELKTAQEHLIQSAKLSALGELISGFAHELNNPLSSVLGYAELAITTEGCAEEVRDMLELTCQEARRCRNIVTNLLGFARKKKPQKTYLNANDVCRNTLNLLSYHFKVNNVKLVTHLAAELPYTMADEHQLQQVLVNILSNAYQAMAGSQDGECLTVVTTHDGTNLAMQISDTGPGIAPENLYRIFDPFFTTKETGTGLGMSLSYGLIKAHGGEITVASEPGEGATFTIVLPILDEDDGAPQPLMVSADAPCPRQKVLVLDDEPKLAQMLVAALRTMGHQATSSTVSPAALEALDQDAYDLVICDLKMPGADGPQVYQFLQRQHPEMLPRLIFSSGDTVSEKNQEFLAATGCLFLPKPFLLQELKEVVARAVHRRTLATVQTAG